MSEAPLVAAVLAVVFAVIRNGVPPEGEVRRGLLLWLVLMLIVLACVLP